MRQATDPVVRLEAELLADGLLADRDQLLAQIETEIAEAVAFAEASPYPQDEELAKDVYA